MKLIQAEWEKRNLGIRSCVEMIIENTDDDIDVLNATKNENAEYVVVKIPPGKIALARHMENDGYRLVEASIKLACRLQDFVTAKVAETVAAAIDAVTMGSLEIERLVAEIHKGIFFTDRVFLGPEFRKEQAYNRYELWVRDEIQAGGKAYECRMNGSPVGFILMKGNPTGVSIPVLLGLYKDHIESGMGAALIAKLREIVVKEGTAAVSVTVSSNNIPVFNAYVSSGFRIREIFYVLVKHNSGGHS